MSRQPVTLLPLVPLAKALGLSDKTRLRGVLRIGEQAYNRHATYGLDEPTARALAKRAGLDAGAVWPDLAPDPDLIPTPPVAALPPVTPDEGGIVWEDPPTSRRGRRSPFDSVWPALMARPGEWARIRTYQTKAGAWAAASNATRGKSNVPAGRWEFRGIRAGDGTSLLYVRYLGPDE